jgi:TPR repeat protein
MKKRILWFVFMTLLIISNVQVIASDLDAQQVDKQMSKELDIAKVIKRAKNGDISAYEDLSRCYQYGIGVEQSNMNMFIIDMIFCNAKGYDFEYSMKTIDDNHPIKVIYNLFGDSIHKEVAKPCLERLKMSSPLEAEAIEIVYAADKKDISFEEYICRLQDNMLRGGELSMFLLSVEYLDSENKEAHEKHLFLVAEKMPFFNNVIAEILMDKRDSTSNNMDDVRLAVKHYKKADEHGMLTSKYAKKLLTIYETYRKDGVKCRKKELLRLNKIINHSETVSQSNSSQTSGGVFIIRESNCSSF